MSSKIEASVKQLESKRLQAQGYKRSIVGEQKKLIAAAEDARDTLTKRLKGLQFRLKPYTGKKPRELDEAYFDLKHRYEEYLLQRESFKQTVTVAQESIAEAQLMHDVEEPENHFVKARDIGKLVPRKKMVTRRGKTYQMTVYENPGEVVEDRPPKQFQFIVQGIREHAKEMGESHSFEEARKKAVEEILEGYQSLEEVREAVKDKTFGFTGRGYEVPPEVLAYAIRLRESTKGEQLKARDIGKLVARKKMVTRQGKTFQMTVYESPEGEETERKGEQVVPVSAQGLRIPTAKMKEEGFRAEFERLKENPAIAEAFKTVGLGTLEDYFARRPGEPALGAQVFHLILEEDRKPAGEKREGVGRAVMDILDFDKMHEASLMRKRFRSFRVGYIVITKKDRAIVYLDMKVGKSTSRIPVGMSISDASAFVDYWVGGKEEELGADDKRERYALLMSILKLRPATVKKMIEENSYLKEGADRLRKLGVEVNLEKPIYIDSNYKSLPTEAKGYLIDPGAMGAAVGQFEVLNKVVDLKGVQGMSVPVKLGFLPYCAEGVGGLWDDHRRTIYIHSVWAGTDVIAHEFGHYLWDHVSAIQTAYKEWDVSVGYSKNVDDFLSTSNEQGTSLVVAQLKASIHDTLKDFLGDYLDTYGGVLSIIEEAEKISGLSKAKDYISARHAHDRFWKLCWEALGGSGDLQDFQGAASKSDFGLGMAKKAYPITTEVAESIGKLMAASARLKEPRNNIEESKRLSGIADYFWVASKARRGQEEILGKIVEAEGYKKKGAAYGTGYWQRPTEMFARAFAQYVTKDRTWGKVNPSAEMLDTGFREMLQKVLGKDVAKALSEWFVKAKAVPIGTVHEHGRKKRRPEIKTVHGWVPLARGRRKVGRFTEYRSLANQTDMEHTADVVRDIYRRRPPGEGEELPVASVKDLDVILTRTTFAMISAGKNPNSKEDAGLTEEKIKERDGELKADLKKSGYVYTSTRGKYGNPEESIMVLCHDANKEELKRLGERYNQDSVLFSRNGKAQLIKTTGPDKGKIAMAGRGHEILENPDDYYTEIKAGSKTVRFAMKLRDVMKALWKLVLRGNYGST